MNDILYLLLRLSFSGSIVAVILFFFKPIFKNRLSKLWQYYIWLIVILRMLVPLTVPENICPFYTENMYKNNLDFIDTDVDLEVDKDDTLNMPIQSKIHKDRNYIGLIWITIVSILSIYKLISYYNILKFIRAGRFEILDKRVLDIYFKVCKNLKIKIKPKLYINRLIQSPMLIGIFCPSILLPQQELSEQHLTYIFQHELIHYKRLDLIYRWLAQFAMCLHWFNPLLYFINREINNNCELSCDEAIIKDLDRAGKQHYGDTLICSLEKRTDSLSSVSITFAENTDLLKERLSSIIKFKKKNRYTTFISSLSTVLLCSIAIFTSAYANTDKSILKLSNLDNIVLKQSIDDTDNSIENIEISTNAVGLSFQESSNNSFEAALAYPQKLAPLYEDAKIHMEREGKKISIGIIYPNGEIKQDTGIDMETEGEGTLIVKIPKRQYNSVKLTIKGITDGNTDFNINTSSLEMYVTGANISFNMVDTCDNIYVKAVVCNFDLYMDSVGKQMTVDNHVANFNLHIGNPKDIDLSIVEMQGDVISDLPSDWKYNTSSYKKGNSIEYKKGNASNRIDVTNKMAAFNIDIKS